MVYFQAYTNTYAPIEALKKLYDEALAFEQAVGLVVGTRADSLTDQMIDYFAELSQRYYVVLEFGIESIYNSTLKRINRGEKIEDIVNTIKKASDAGRFKDALLL